jgi:hypothetical protein
MVLDVSATNVRVTHPFWLANAISGLLGCGLHWLLQVT